MYICMCIYIYVNIHIYMYSTHDYPDQNCACAYCVLMHVECVSMCQCVYFRVIVCQTAFVCNDFLRQHIHLNPSWTSSRARTHKRTHGIAINHLHLPSLRESMRDTRTNKQTREYYKIMWWWRGRTESKCNDLSKTFSSFLTSPSLLMLTAFSRETQRKGQISTKIKMYILIHIHTYVCIYI